MEAVVKKIHQTQAGEDQQAQEDHQAQAGRSTRRRSTIRLRRGWSTSQIEEESRKSVGQGSAYWWVGSKILTRGCIKSTFWVKLA